MKKISLSIICLLFFASSANSQTRWMRLPPRCLMEISRPSGSLNISGSLPARIGKLHFQKHEVGRARQQLEAAVAGGAEDGRLLYELGYCCRVQEDNDQALDYLRRAAGKLSREDPDHIYHFNSEYLIGNIYEEKNR